MPTDTLERDVSPIASANDQPRQKQRFVLVRLQPDDHDDDNFISMAIAVACGLGCGVRLIACMNPPDGATAPVDPVEWDLRQRAVAARLSNLVKSHTNAGCPIDYQVHEQFVLAALAGSKPVIAVSTAPGSHAWQEDSRLLQLFNNGPASVLVVPQTCDDERSGRIRRIMTAMDGSARAECALPSALAIAGHHGAELVVVHVAPEAPLTAGNSLDAETLALAEELHVRNTRAAENYLGELRARHANDGIRFETRLLEKGDVRRKLVAAARAERADLIVLAAHGASGHGDVHSGAVASHVMGHSTIPVLMIGAGTVRCNNDREEATHVPEHRIASASCGVQ